MSTEERHGTPRHREIAVANTILLGQVGSGLHGVTTGDDDRDEMGICIEPAEAVIGLEKFEQYIYRTQPDGARSGPGDLDLVIYSLRKWTRLAAAGNPTVLLLLWLPDAEVVTRTRAGEQLQAASDMFVTKAAGERFLGYLNRQRGGIEGTHHRHTNRPELVAQYGFDTKYAYHAIRLGLQGCEAMRDGRVNLPMLAEHREYLLRVRAGEVSLREVMDRLDEITCDLEHLVNTADLPEEANWAKVDDWLVDMYTEHWATPAAEVGGLSVGASTTSP
ncbi:Predicted nucleotidyltransferase [Mycobacteroides abscessus subsp. massiliense]|uniref:nucleotidyltransferase domain-containing protein n=1 Tax=Mycobacteroides abscessus TaxID=36809 RepID=UPI0009A70C9B|nr:nucleotidyltransferase domain-containing protein [Mycobacteroides abscessus]SKM81459.1 Predicted nucleotidyltransferase [Mycobacteroides abscessus subsp. massiliense]SKM98083.1 Predicted nucleotidyltransferase [Mycobacteroides abscessus subsp. massiliense]SKN76820.1 Predicted nucleotidyltransferase [Mycobacteroides abscessus subsp. massiliense]SKN96304.1 Predicted nucleotidyltransferase [Mycobacteroides abscessus subsp. massiliense]SKO21651.1 Predicted nucleotidyltransferase [Mycobacteroide